MAPITKKPTTGSTAKVGSGVFGKSSSSIGKNTSMSSGKSSNILGSSSKSYMGSGSNSYGSKSSSSYLGSSGKNDSLFGSSGKNTKLMPSSAKTLESGKTASFFGYSAKTDNASGLSGKSKLSSTTEKSSFLGGGGKNSNILGPSDKNKHSPFSGKVSPDPSREYPSFISPEKNKSQTRIGIIWIPTRKRNKKKDMVYNPHNYDRYHEKSPSMYSYMSGDSPNYQQPHKKKEEETDLLVPERPKVTTVAVNTGITAASIDLPSEDNPSNPDEKQEFIKHHSEDSKEGGGDAIEGAKKNNSDYYENKDNDAKAQDEKWDKDKQGDKVDSVYLRPPPPHKTRSAASTNDDEDCGIKCLYYTLQCCDCVLM